MRPHARRVGPPHRPYSRAAPYEVATHEGGVHDGRRQTFEGGRVRQRESHASSMDSRSSAPQVVLPTCGEASVADGSEPAALRFKCALGILECAAVS